MSFVKYTHTQEREDSLSSWPISVGIGTFYNLFDSNTILGNLIRRAPMIVILMLSPYPLRISVVAEAWLKSCQEQALAGLM